MDPRYKKPLLWSLLLHLGLFIALFLHIASPVKLNSPVGDVNKPIVKAVAVNRRQVERELARINRERELVKRQALLKKQRLQKAAAERVRQRKLKAERKRQLAKKKALQKALAVKKKRTAELRKKQLLAQKAAKRKAAELAKQRAKQLVKQQRLAQEKALQQQLAQEVAAAQAKRMQTEVDKYKSMIISAISQNWVVPENANDNETALLIVQVGPGGVVLSVRVVKPSGDPVLDRSARTAVLQSSPLPVPTNPQLFNQFRVLRLTVRPEGIVSG